MKAISINAARELGKKAGARRVVILALDDDTYGITTWGLTRRECGELAAWAESKTATAVLRGIAEAGLRGGSILTAGDPDTPGEVGVG